MAFSVSHMIYVINNSWLTNLKNAAAAEIIGFSFYCLCGG